MLVSSLYNIVDQVFIGQGVGYLGNAATNVAFPLTTISLAIALLIGIGSASLFSLNLGAGEKEDAVQVVGTAFTMMLVFGVIYAVLIEIFSFRCSPHSVQQLKSCHMPKNTPGSPQSVCRF